MSRLLLPFADQQIEITSLSAGNIALTVGLKQVKKKTYDLSNLVFCQKEKATSGLVYGIKTILLI